MYRARNERAEAVLAAFCENLGAVTKMQAVKFPYLADVIAVRVLGEPITNARYETWEHGVVCAPLFYMLEHQAEDGGFRVERRPYTETQRVQTCGDDHPILSTAEQAIVEYVASEYGQMLADDLGRLTKRMNPDVPPGAWGNDRKVQVNQDTYDHLTEEYQAMAATVNRLDHTLWDRVQPLLEGDNVRDWI